MDRAIKCIYRNKIPVASIEYRNSAKKVLQNEHLTQYTAFYGEMFRPTTIDRLYSGNGDF
jgi:hypothetical protein